MGCAAGGARVKAPREVGYGEAVVPLPRKFF